MPVEIEVKIRVEDLNKLRGKLLELNARHVSDRHFEENFVLDTQDGRLRSAACLLRVRKTKDMESVTFKGPSRPTGIFKSREENETRVGSADTLLEIFSRIGMRTWFKYEKYREEFSLPIPSGQAAEILVALDDTPIGAYAELEGSEQGIREVAHTLGFLESQFLRDSYYSLYARFCRERGEEPGYMVFRQ